MKISKETKADIKDGLKKAGFVLGTALLIVAFGTSLTVPGFAIPVGVGLAGFGGYLTTEGTKKEKLKVALGWAALAGLFTTLAVLGS